MKSVNRHFNLAAFFAPAPSEEFLTSVRLVSFSLSVYIYVAGFYKGNYFAVFDVVFLASWSLRYSVRVSSLKTTEFPRADIFHPCGVVVSLIYSPY